MFSFCDDGKEVRCYSGHSDSEYDAQYVWDNGDGGGDRVEVVAVVMVMVAVVDCSW